MRISELSATTGVPVPTIKYYLRERLLPPGTLGAPNQAEYGEEHVRRLRLIRALRDVGDLSIEEVRSVVEALDERQRTLHDVLGVAHRALARPRPRRSPELARAEEEVDRLLDDLGWRVAADAPDRRTLAGALAALRALGREAGADQLRPYAEAADRIAEREIASIGETVTATEAVERAVIGTVLYEVVLAALRRLAQEHHSARRLSLRRASSPSRSRTSPRGPGARARSSASSPRSPRR